MTKQFRDFESAREFARSLGLKNGDEWKEYCKSGNKPDDIPSTPKNSYKNDWKSSGDWLGTNFLSYADRTYRSFEDAKNLLEV